VDLYASDEEKGEEIKQWWRDNGFSVVIGIFFAVAVFMGGRYWQASQQSHLTQAANHFQQLTVFLDDNKITEATSEGDLLFSDFSDTPHAIFAAFELVKQSVARDDLLAAKTYLEWTIEHAKLSNHILIAKLRLAQVVSQQGEHSAALAIIQQTETGAFASLFKELEGDIFLAQEKNSDAEQAYRTVLSGLDNNDPRYMMVKLKLDDVNGS
jgi:predicted negative regulator of RcsB-dependent stress response